MTTTITLVILAAGAGVFWESYEHKNDAYRVVYTGRERGKTEEIPRLYQELLNASTWEEQQRIADRLQEGMAEWRHLHQRLMAIDHGPLLDFGDRDWIQERIERLEEILAAIERLVDDLVHRVVLSQVAVTPADIEEAAPILLMDLHHHRYMTVLDSIDIQIARDAYAGIFRLQAIDSALILASSVLLLALSWFLLRPALKVIERQMAELDAHRRELADRRHALAQALVGSERWSRHHEEQHHSIAHDARSPLTAIIMSAELAARSGDGEIHGHLQRIARNARQAIAMLERSLFAPRDPTESRVDPQAWLEAIVDRHRERARACGSEIALVLDEDLPATLRLDAARVERVLHNLLDNALVHARGARVTVSVDEPGAGILRIAVRDAGPGMEQAELERLLASSLRPQPNAGGGFGLGLGIAKRLVEHLGGDLVGRSSPGEGTSIELLLPRAGAPVAPPPDLPPDALSSLRESQVLEHARVLIVDDDHEVQAAMTDVVLALGAECDSTADPDHALARATRADERYDAILLNINLDGGADGFDLVRRLRAAGVATAIIGMTARRLSVDREACVASGCDDLLLKPVSSFDLAEKLLKWAGGLA